MNKIDKLIINGQEIEPIDEKDLEMTWFNHNAYKEVTLTFGNESFNVMVLKTDIDRLVKQFKKVEV